MRGKISPELIKILSDPKGRQEFKEVLRKGRGKIQVGDEVYDVSVIGSVSNQNGNVGMKGAAA